MREGIERSWLQPCQRDAQNEAKMAAPQTVNLLLRDRRPVLHHRELRLVDSDWACRSGQSAERERMMAELRRGEEGLGDVGDLERTTKTLGRTMRTR